MEERAMRRAIELAMRAEATEITPNPRVGAVLLHNGRVIGEGYHQRCGQAHAEVNCLNSVKPQDRHLLPHSTMYVTLEPCAHEGRTPSCAKRLAMEGVARVVVGRLDPNPLTSGKGVAILKAAGVQVEVGLLHHECSQVAKVFLVNQMLHLPFVTLKWCQSHDGFIDHHRTLSSTQPPLRLSSAFTQLLTHRLRSQQSAIAVGYHTFVLDVPKLNNRLWLPSPHSPRPILITSHNVPFPKGWIRIPDLSCHTLERLYTEQGITSLLVEGGAATHHHMLQSGLWHEIRQEVSPTLVHEGVPAPQIPASALVVSVHTFKSQHSITYYQNPLLHTTIF